ncbi:MAG: DUF4834 family protein [Bacteroidota bacterium]
MFFKVILFIVLVYYVVRFLLRVLIRNFVFRVIRDGQPTAGSSGQPFGGRGNPFSGNNQNYSSRNSADGVRIDTPPNKNNKGRNFDPGGEYVDYEEVK